MALWFYGLLPVFCFLCHFWSEILTSKLQRWGGASKAELGPQRSPTTLVQLTFQSFTFQWCTLREGLSFSWFGKWSRWFLMCFFFSSLQHTESDFKSRLKSRPELEELRAQVSWGAGEHCPLQSHPWQCKADLPQLLKPPESWLCELCPDKEKFPSLWSISSVNLNKDKCIPLCLTPLYCEWKGSTVKFGFSVLLFWHVLLLVCERDCFSLQKCLKLIMITWIASLDRTAQI